MPQLGETVTEGTITRWFKQVGETVAADEPLFEVSTDKVDSEVPAPVSGVVSEIIVAEGDTVDVGARLAVISDSAAGAPPRRRPRPPRLRPPSPRRPRPRPRPLRLPYRLLRLPPRRRRGPSRPRRGRRWPHPPAPRRPPPPLRLRPQRLRRPRETAARRSRLRWCGR